jgi:hypothetical protein
MSEVDLTDRLFGLLPAFHQTRDAEAGDPLRALLRLVGREAQVVEDDLRALYDSWFVETCPDWVVPYIGDLVGFSPAPEAGDLASLDVSDPRARLRVMAPRRDVAGTVHARRRRGTLALLEELARDSAGWPGRAVELFALVAWAQNVNHQRLQAPATADLRDLRALADVDGPFDRVAHTPDVRRPNATLAPGRCNLPAVALFAWRLRAFTISHCQADCLEDVGPHRFTFSVLGNDAPLFHVPAPDAQTAISGPLELPVPIRRRDLAGDDGDGACADHYGLGRSLAIWAPDWPVRGAPQPVPRERIIAADLSSWTTKTPAGHIAVDPELGRFAFPARQLPRQSVYVSYAYGFAAPLGGGEYSRPVHQPSGAVVYHVGAERPDAHGTIKAALARWRDSTPRPPVAVIEILDSEVYTEPLDIHLDAGESLQIRAAEHARPVIRLLDYIVDRADPLAVTGARGSSLTLDGLLVSGRGLMVRGPDPESEEGDDGDLCEVVLRHCTLVPGWGLHGDCAPLRPAEPSIIMYGSQAHLRIEHSIVGSIVVTEDAVGTDPVRLDVSDSIVDATGHDCARPECEALTGPDGTVAHVVASFRRSTVFGRVHAHAVVLGENSIFTGLMRVARRQLGCLRFCAVVPGSRTPRRHACEPDRTGALPVFAGSRYGTPDYARLAETCPAGIREGADDASEMGVYHDLFEPQRAALLRRRLEEFTPAGFDAGLFWAT